MALLAQGYILVMEILDREILRRLQINAALSVGDLADKVGISKSACWRRVQKLEKEGVIKERVTLLDAKSIGLSLTCLLYTSPSPRDS